MPPKRPSPKDEKPQRERFIEAAREIGASEDAADFNRALDAVAIYGTPPSGRAVAPGFNADCSKSKKRPVSKKKLG